MDLSKEFAKDHFRRAIELCPRCLPAYSRMFDQVLPRWGGSRAELLAFARECIETGFWDERIPDFGRRAVDDLINAGGAPRRSALADPELWEVISMYYQNSRKNAPPDAKRFALNIFAKYGGYGRHFEEIAGAYKRLEQEGVDPRVFWDSFTYGYLRDLVTASTGSGPKQAEAAVRTALDEGDFDKAESLMAKIDVSTEEGQKLRDRFQYVIKAGRALQSERSLELSGQGIYDLFDGVNELWSVDGDKLVCKPTPNSDTTILLPFGIERAEIEASLFFVHRPHWFHVHSHTRALRDPVSLTYQPLYGRVQLFRSNAPQYGEYFDIRQSTFRMRLDREVDQFNPLPELHWQAHVVEHVPSGFGFQAITYNKTAEIHIEKLRIKLLEKQADEENAEDAVDGVE
jgi:hypothetical protein